MITKFIFCLLAAGALGFILGWILSSLVKNEKLEEKYTNIKDEFDTKRAELNHAYSDLDTKEHELTLSNNNMQQVQRELLMKSMEIEEYKKKGFVSQDFSELELENNTLKEEISEYKYLENENDLLRNELKELGVEKEQLLEKIENNQNISIVTPLLKKKKKSRKNKKMMTDSHIQVLQKDLKRAKNKLKKMGLYLDEINGEKRKEKKKKLSLKNDDILVFDFKKEPLESTIKKSLKSK